MDDMNTSSAWGTSSYRRQDLLLEFASLKQVKLRGIYATLTPDVPQLWRCVLFVREGPYEGAVLRFRVSFSDQYPFELPVVIFDRHINHPLIMPEQAIQSDDVFTDRDPRERSSSQNLAGAMNLEPGFRDFVVYKNVKASVDGHIEFRLNVIDIFLYIRSCFNDVRTLSGLRDHDIYNSEAWSAWKAHNVRSEDEDTMDRAGAWKQHMNYLVRQNVESEALFDYASKPRSIPT